MGLGWFLSVDWSLAWSDSEKTSTSHQHLHYHHPVNWPHLCVPVRVSRLRGWWIIISLPVPRVCLLCQHASSVPVCQMVISEVSVLPWTFPGGSRSPRCPEGQDMVPLCQMAQNPQDCTYGAILLVMMIFKCFNLSCDGLLAVCITINCFIVLVYL